MQNFFNIASKSECYKVEFSQFKPEYLNEAIILVDKEVLRLYPNIKGNIITIEATEQNKSLAEIPKILETLKQLRATKQTTIIAIGGGVIQDISCFVANIYMRGLEWRFIPTTSLAMVDSCIGGKSSINVGDIKNLAGTFYPPTSIIIDVNFLKTLSKEDKISGIFEFIKICFAANENDIFEKALELLMDFENNFEEIIFLSLKTKKWFIEIDEFDKKERQLLNFGHTFGHAIESVSNYQIIHGIAVGIGMLIEIEFTNNNTKRKKELQDILLKLLSEVPNALQIAKNLNIEEILNVFESDKKHTKNEYNLIILNNEGFLVRKSFPKNKEFKLKFKQIYEKI